MIGPARPRVIAKPIRWAGRDEVIYYALPRSGPKSLRSRWTRARMVRNKRRNRR